MALALRRRREAAGKIAMVKPIAGMVEPIAWDVDERNHHGHAWSEVRRLARRSRRRPWLTLVATLLISGGVVGMRSRKPRIFQSRFAMRVTESDLDADTSPRTVGSLRNYVAEVCFSNQR